MQFSSVVKSIKLRDVLNDMRKLDKNRNPIPFSLKVRTLNKQNKTGGNLKYYINATLMQSAKNQKLTTDSKIPNHFENKTRNIKIDSGQIKKINILFIIEYNGQKVVY